MTALTLLALPLALRLPAALPTRREAIGAAAAFVALPAVAGEPKAAKELRSAGEEMRKFVDLKEGFVAGLEAADPSAPQLPKTVPLSTFQKLEGNADPEFMEAAVDYLEAMRNARDLVRLAKLTKEKVIISTKETGKPREEKVVDYGAAEGSGLAPTKEYAERAFQEAVGASVVLDAAVKFLPLQK